jgi:hypothetical protein
LQVTPRVSAPANALPLPELGKEWWIGTHWGVGVALEFFFAVNETVRGTMRSRKCSVPESE